MIQLVTFYAGSDPENIDDVPEKKKDREEREKKQKERRKERNH